MSNYQVIVIGGGPGGYIAAIRAAQKGFKTALVEKDALGGTCLNRGCIPTKALLHSADVFYELKELKTLGITLEGTTEVNYKKMAKRKDKVVKQLCSGVEALEASYGVDVIKGAATLTDAHTVSVDGTTYEAEHIILATGSRPADIPIPGATLDGVLNSDDVLALEELPESVIIIGGGVIGTEFATLMSHLGKKVFVVEALPSILNGMEPAVCETAAYLMEQAGVEIHVGARVKEIKEGMSVVFEEGGEEKELTAERVIMAIGRTPVSQALGLEQAGVETDQKGFVKVDSYMRTNVSGIYAIGDLTGVIQLAHVATAQALVAVDYIAGIERAMDYSAVPSCIYSSPEIAAVGMTQKAAEDAGYEVKCGQFNVSANGRSLASGCMDGFCKIVTDAKTDRVLGCHIVAPNATEMIGEAVLAVQQGMTAETLGNAIHAHPTVGEIIMEAAHDVHGLCCHNMKK